MKIGVVSDTHGDYESWEKASRFLKDCDIILHAGDVLYHGPRNPLPKGYNPKKLAEAINSCEIPILIAEGNCDAYVDQMVIDVPITPYVFAVIEGKRIMVNHGHLLTDEEIEKLILRYSLDYFIVGHTHIPVVKKIGKCTLINPGSTSLSKREDNVNSIGFIEIGKDKVYVINLENGEKIIE
ncbi:phosphodiesterase [Caldanaerobacter sp.]|uniref:phosphodiesterase n=1 Tax=Caldanaerobacter sp. TaxID=2930036 RepID=UPI003C7545F6